MDQGDVSTTGTHYARLLLIFFGAVLGFLALSFVFGSSSASADDGGDSRGLLDPVDGIVASATAPVAETVTAVTDLATAPAATPVTAIATPATGAVDDAVSSLLGDAVGAYPVTSIVAPVTGLADTALARLQEATGVLVTPVTGALGAVTAPAAAVATDAATASDIVFSAPATLLGVAADLLGTPASGGLPQPDATGATTASGALAAVAAGIGLALLLMRRGRALLPVIVPGAPVYDTDSSPD